MRTPVKREPNGNALIDASGKRFTLSQIIDWVNDQGLLEKELKEANDRAEKNRLRYEKAEFQGDASIKALEALRKDILSIPKWKQRLIKKHLKIGTYL